MPSAGVSFVISAADRASQTIERINTRIARMQAPVRRVQAAFGRFASLSGLSRLNSGIVGVGRSAVGAFQSLGQIVPVLGTLTGAASVAGVYRLASAWAQVGTDLRTTSRTMGMAPQKLQAMQNAAKLAGGSAESMTGALQQLSQMRWAATHNQDPAAAAQFRAVGVSMEELQKLSPDKLFQRVAARLRDIRDPAAQAVAATTLFGGAAQGLMPIFQQTGREFENNLKLAERYGLFNQKGVDAADRLRKAQQKLELAVRGFGNSLAESLEPAIRPVIEGMAEWIAANRKWIAQDITGYVRQFVTWLRAGGWNQIKGDVLSVYQAINDVVKRLGGWKSAGRDALIAIGAIYAAPVLTGMLSLATAIIGVATAFGRMRKSAIEAGAASRAAQAAGGVSGGLGGGLLSRAALPLAAGYAAYRTIRATDPDDNLRSMPDRYIPGASYLDDAASRLSGGLVGRSYAQQQKIANQEDIKNAYAFYRSRGWNGGNSAGIVANLVQESGMDPHREGDNGEAYGIGQWHADRQALFKRLYGHDIRQSNLDEQLKFFDYELNTTEHRGGDLLRQMRSPAASAAIVSGYVERPKDQLGEMVRRGQLANQLAGKYFSGPDPSGPADEALRPVSPILVQAPVAVDPLNPGKDVSVPDRYPSAPPLSVPSGTASGGALAETMHRIQLEIDQKNTPPGTRVRAKQAPPGTRVVNRTPVQQAMQPALTSVGN
ncbi:phage tail tip lysozyme [Komagataeibacter oboediens]|uniref:phage tail tip lysozyme n=1 Tax=Komagataeibacter oboediens TaxID=65958 RepID=UPI001908E521|nr:phage tail tip lysozyme [Komagataeibacter oboediens]GCE81744.1 phage-related tail protein [Komagataeibacter oboediens]